MPSSPARRKYGCSPASLRDFASGTITSSMSSATSCRVRFPSVELILASPIIITERRRLFTLPDQPVLQDQQVHPSAHEAPVSVLRSTNDRFAPHVEGRVDNKRAARPVMERS